MNRKSAIKRIKRWLEEYNLTLEDVDVNVPLKDVSDEILNELLDYVAEDKAREDYDDYLREESLNQDEDDYED